MTGRSTSSPITSLSPHTPFYPNSSGSSSSTRPPHTFIPRSQSYTGFSLISATTALAPLPPLARDPHHVLPLSLPSTPRQSPPLSRRNSQCLSPRTSFHAESEDSDPSSSSGRTSFSNSSGSRSSSEEDERTFVFSKYHAPTSWWTSRAGTSAVSPKILQPPPQLRLSTPPRPSRFMSSGTRHWRWLRELFVSDAPETSARAVSRSREREKLMAGIIVARTKEESKWWRRVRSFIPTTPWGFVSGAYLASVVRG